MLEWLKDGHAQYDKLKMQFYEKNYRGVHAARKIYVNKLLILIILIIPHSPNEPILFIF